MIILDGKKLSKQIEENLKQEALTLKQKLGFTPKLATVLVGEDASSKVYVNMKIKACKRIGIDSEYVKLPTNTTTQQLLKVIDKLNKNKEICGILLQHPTPKHIDEKKAFNAISLKKDVDGVNTASFGLMSMNMESFKSATPLGIMLLIKHYNIDLSRKNVLVIGRSQILGKPISVLMLNENATVTIAHSYTKNLKNLAKKADVIVACVGKANFIKQQWLKKGVIVVDAGYNKNNVGDVDKTNIDKKASYYTPVPGGVGPMTIVSLLLQTVKACQNLINQK